MEYFKPASDGVLTVGTIRKSRQDAEAASQGLFFDCKWQILLQYQLMEIYTPLGPTIKEQALRSCLGVLSPFSYCPHSENTVGCGLEALHLCLLTHTGYDLCCHLGADLPVVVVLLLSQDVLATSFNYCCSTEIRLIKQKNKNELDGHQFNRSVNCFLSDFWIAWKSNIYLRSHCALPMRSVDTLSLHICVGVSIVVDELSFSF